MAAGGQDGSQDNARLRIDIEAPQDGSDEFTIRIYSGHSTTTRADRELMEGVYSVMTGLMAAPARTRTVTDPDGTRRKAVPKPTRTWDGRKFPRAFPFAKRRK